VIDNIDNKFFLENGYLTKKNFLENSEIKLFSKKIKEYKVNSAKSEFDDKDLVELICRNKTITLLKNLIGNDVAFLHDLSILKSKTSNVWSWHRDNPCRRTGFGPDWNLSEKYRVVTIIYYLCDSNVTETYLSLIKKSFLKKYRYTFSNLLRNIHLRIKNKKYLLFLRKTIERIISKKIIYKAGDLLIFYTNLFHSGSAFNSNSIKNRDAIVVRYGIKGAHSTNFMIYELYYRDAIERLRRTKHIDYFFSKLKNTKIFYDPFIEKKKIDNAYIPKEIKN